jgi:hypothetical protein
MSLIGNVTPGNNPYAGGNRTPNAPPPNLGGSIASANTGNAPLAGVNPPGQPFLARNNEGSNIGVPYTRLVPLGSKYHSSGLMLEGSADQKWIGGEGAAMPALDGFGGMGGGADQYGNKPAITETEDLRASRVGFILGRRGAGVLSYSVQGNPNAVDGPDDYGSFNAEMNVNGVMPLSGEPNFVGFLAPGMPGTERFQKLCSMEFLKRYFGKVLRFKTIDLSALDLPDAAEFARVNAGNAAAVGQMAMWANSGTAATLASNPKFQANAPAGKNALNTGDIAPMLGEPGSDLALLGAGFATPAQQGIFVGDVGPFLRGKGGAGGGGMINGTVAGRPYRSTPTANFMTPAFSVSRCLGDELAFEMLEQAMERAGLTDWRPDGIVLSKGANDPSDKLSDEYFEARDGQLYNMRIQGPAHTTTWTGDPAMEVMPGDKVFVVIVADVWFDDDTTAGNIPPEVSAWLQDKTNKAKWEAYATARNNYFKDNLLPKRAMTQFETYRQTVFDGSKQEKTVLANFRTMVTTSSQMVQYSYPKFDSSGQQVVDRAHDGGNDHVQLIQGASRMGLRLGELGGEYIVGGWQIGTVLDSAASRAVMPGNGSLGPGVRTAPNSMAHNVYVNISWWSADRMWRSFMNVENKLTPRYVKHTGAPTKPVNQPAPGVANAKAAKKVDDAAKAAHQVEQAARATQAEDAQEAVERQEARQGGAPGLARASSVAEGAQDARLDAARREAANADAIAAGRSTAAPRPPLERRNTGASAADA